MGGKKGKLIKIVSALMVVLCLFMCAYVPARAFVIADDVGAAALIAYLASIMGITFDSTGDMQDAVTGFMNAHEDRSDIDSILLSQSGNSVVFGSSVAVAVVSVMSLIREWFGYDETLPGEVYIPQTGYAVMVYSDGVVYADGVPIMDGLDTTKAKRIHFTSINQTIYPAESLPMGFKKVTPEDSYYKGQVMSVVNGAVTWDCSALATWDDPLNTDAYISFSRRQNTIDINMKLYGASSGHTYDLSTYYSTWVNDVISRLDSTIYDLPSSSLPYGTTGIDETERFLEKMNTGEFEADMTEVMSDVQSTDKTAPLSYTQADVLANAGIETAVENSPDYYSVNLTDIFPFCIPFDVVAFLQVMSAEREAPEFIIPLNFPPLGMHYDFDIDLSLFDSVAQILRTMELLAFCVGLMLVTRKLIKW